MGVETANIFIQYVPHTGDAATWAGSVGALLAFGGTIWVATDQARQKRQRELNEAILAAARLLPQMFKYRRAVEALLKDMQFGLSQDSIPSYGPHFDSIKQAFTWTTADVMPLTILPRNVAFYLEHIKATSQEIIDIYYLDLENASGLEGLFNELKYDPMSVHLAMRACCTRFKDILPWLDIVLEECSAIIPRTWNEL